MAERLRDDFLGDRPREETVGARATYAYVNPVVAVFLGWLILSEPVTGSTLVGAAVVVAGVALVVASEARDKAEHHQPRQESTA